jgi:mono/diheme cytochrome c family protein
MKSFYPSIAPALLLLFLTGSIAAIDIDELPPPAKQKVNFVKEILPIFKKHCVKCHGPDKQKSDYRIDVKARAFEGGEMGSAIIPGKSAESPLVHFISGLDEEVLMPPKGDLLEDKTVGLIRAWIDQGADWPDDAGAQIADPMEHWAFKPLRQPGTPRFMDPMDAFLWVRLEAKGLKFSPQAEKRTLIRRLYLVMHGLPPTVAEVKAFVENKDPRAYAKLVERVLASPRYGERWGQHWLDVARFAESHGFEMNRERPHAWRYRDYVIDSFNADKPYNQFVKEQLAGGTFGAEAATGFIVAGPHDMVLGKDPAHQATLRQNDLAEMVNATGTTFLGLTLGCARCHNHKFDPVSQNDFYAMTAIFAGVKHADRTIAGKKNLQRKTKLLEELTGLDKSLAGLLKPPAAYDRNEEFFAPVKAKSVRFTVLATSCRAEPCIDELEVFDVDKKNVALGGALKSSGDFANNPKHKLAHLIDGKFGNSRSWISNERGKGWVQITFSKPARIERIVWQRDRLGVLQDRLPTNYKIEIESAPGQWRVVASSNSRVPFGTKFDANAVAAQKDLTEAQKIKTTALLKKHAALRKELAEIETGSLAYAGKFAKPPKTFRLHRGDAMQPREAVAAGTLLKFNGARFAAEATEATRRTALAEWIVSPENPLTARVIVNRVWQYHFGTGLVDTPNDFGHNGAPPSHPEFLDWLAADFITHRWSLKHLHRRILGSRAFTQSSAPLPAALKRDAQSRLLWRFPPRRLEAEAIRDSILAASGKLDLAMGGPGFSLFEIQKENVRHYFPKQEFGPADWRRMVYATKFRQELDDVFGAFDCPDGNQSVPRRGRSTTPMQALNLLNSPFILDQANHLAARVKKDAGPNVEAQVRRAFHLTLGRVPEIHELAAAKKLATDHGLPALARALFNTHEFITIP